MFKSLTLMRKLLEDSSCKCSTVASKRDFLTIENRARYEGWSFLTITLPAFSEDFFDCLEIGQITSNHFLGWKKRSCLPAFLQGFTNLVFDAKTGGLLDEPCKNAIQSIRQICATFKKVNAACSKTRINRAIKQYVEIDNDLSSLPIEIDSSYFEAFQKVSALMWSEVFGKELDLNDLIPHHGPGSTAEKFSGNMKYVAAKQTFPTRLGKFFRDGELFFNSEESYFHSGVEIPQLDLHEELPVRVVTVPKTLKAPRIIALEPVAMQMAQQSVKDYVVRKLERSKLTSGHINFVNQDINRDLALANSSSQRLGTLDLSAASDRVHKDLIWHMLKVNPQLRDLVFTTRSATADVPDHGKIYLNKFASMGSALCFPIEAMFFTTVLVVARLISKDLPVSLSNVKFLMRDIYVYGDDIIIPANEVEAVIPILHAFGNRVGLTKSFWKGKFRESCGMDAYDGRDITPTYVRQPIPRRQRDTSCVISTVATANQLYFKGFVRAAMFLVKETERLTGFSLPVVAITCEGLGWDIPLSRKCKTRWNTKLQRLEVRTLVPQTSSKRDGLWGYNALTKCLLKLELNRGSSLTTRELTNQSVKSLWRKTRERFTNHSFKDKQHLTHSPRIGALKLRHRWVSIV